MMVQAGARANAAGICPFCSNRIEGEQYKFCPFCGRDLLVATFNTEPDFRYDDVETVDDVIQLYEKFVAEKKREGLPDEVIQAAAVELVKTLKSKVRLKIRLSEKPLCMTGPDGKGPSTQFLESDVFSIVLKHCPQKEQLADRLQNYLLRSLPAIQMALGTMPSLIIYKRKLDRIISILRAFVEEQSTITLIPGQFVADKPFSQMYPAWTQLDVGTRQLIDAAPLLLWAGQQIYAVYHITHAEEGKAVLIISDQGLYLLSGDLGTTGCCCRDIPYYLLEDVYPGSSRGSLEIVYRSSEQEEDIDFPEAREAEAAYETIQRAMKEGYDKLQIRRHCPKCGAVGQENIFQAYERDQCEHCGFSIERKLVYR